MPREVYAPDDIAILSQAVEAILRDQEAEKGLSMRRREEVAWRAFRVASADDAFDLDELVFQLRRQLHSAA